MGTYRFRLATVLKLREQERDERRLELARAADAEAVLSQTMEQLLAEIRQIDQMQRALPGELDVERLLEAVRYRFSLTVQQKDLQAKLAAVREEVERRREILLEADRAVKSLEKLRELQSERHLAQEKRRETTLLDELAIRHRAVEQRSAEDAKC
jgi:flagellar protein FliJ